MKNLFSWRLPPSESDLINLWDNAIFVFDTNFLLDLYRVSYSTAQDFLSILERLEGRIWLPYQVADEFFERKEEVINAETESFEKAFRLIEEWEDDQVKFKDLEKKICNSGRILSSEMKCVFNQQNVYKEKIQETAKCFKEHIQALALARSELKVKDDWILDQLHHLFEGKIGKSFCEEDLQKLYREGEVRYSKKIPPGFEDSDKKGNKKYGDLYTLERDYELC